MTTQHRIMAALRKLPYKDQMRVLDEVKATLTTIHEKREQMRIDWGTLGMKSLRTK